jgi:hypothetical protein
VQLLSKDYKASHHLTSVLVSFHVQTCGVITYMSSAANGRDKRRADVKPTSSNGSEGSTTPTSDQPKSSTRPPRAKSDAWATPPELITTQEAQRRELEKFKRIEREKYLYPLEENADPNSVVRSSFYRSLFYTDFKG